MTVGLSWAPAALAVLAFSIDAPGPALSHAPVRSSPAADTILWTPTPLRTPVDLDGDEGPPPPLLTFGLARVPVSRLDLPAVDLPADSVPFTLSLAPPRDRLARFGTFGRPVGFAAVPEPRPRGRLVNGSRLVNEYADLGFEVRGSGQVGGDWTEFRPCDAAVQVTCEPSLLPELRPDINFAATADGTITDRIQVQVDYDQAREFGGANQVNISYQGQPGELLQRFAVGDVRFDLPPSHFIQEGVPAGNFGFQAGLEAGPLSFESVWAQQSGEVTSRRFRLEASGRGFSQSDTLVLDDADYVQGQFFFLFDPSAFADFPHVDVLSLSPADAPVTLAPGAEPIQLYRSEIDLFAQQQVEGYIQADAVAGEGVDGVTESAWFRYLQPGQDYVVHPSGLWVALRSPLRDDELLAVTYVTAAGDTIGTYNPEGVYNAGGRPTLRLLKASAGQHQPGRATWLNEMHQVYRVSASNDVDPASVDLSISLGEASAGRTFTRRPNGDDLTFLKLFGLDEESPQEVIDGSHVYRPALESFDDQPPVTGTFVVFPTLEPFADPPPLRSLALDPEEVAEILGGNRNERIYESPDPFERENGGVFRLNLAYEVRSEGLASSFALGAVGIRESTERVTLGDRVLIRDVDYAIDYDIGQLTLLNVDALLTANPGRVLEVSWEQRSLFQIAPTSVFGVNTQYRLGEYGALNVIGLYQSEDELLRRPQLGVESSAVALGGINGLVNASAPLLDRFLASIPGLRAGDGSTVRLSGEATVSLPNPNTQGAVYIDDFDATNSRPLSVQSGDWRRASRPQFTDGAEAALPPVPDADNLAPLTWQHSWIVEGLGGDSLGVFQGFDPQGQIDQQIRITGTAVRETGLFVRFEPESGDEVGPANWAGITTVLSPTGADLTRSDFIEFYVRDGDFLTLVVDLGTVSEDAFFVDDDGNVNGFKDGSGAPWGLGILDQEADPRRGEVWGNVADARGVWGESCFAERARVYRLGDPRANCTRGNGRPDSEDMDEDGNLDTLERYRRFVVPLDGTSPFLVRDRIETGSQFRLYRIPIQDPTGLDVGGPITDADLRAVRHLRITVAGQRRDSFVLARMGIVGSRWIKRSITGVLNGLGGDTLAVAGRVEVGPVSKLTVGDAYLSPPRVLEQLDDPTSAFGGQGIEFNERSLAVDFEDLQPGDRVEVYNRFPQRPRDFLSYREARLWVAAPRGDFGPSVPTYFFVKVGTDDTNFYLYRTRLQPGSSPDRIIEEDWLPEVAIDFDVWLDLRRQAEESLVSQPRQPGGPPLVLWSADSTYAISLGDRGRAPSLASVREISLGVMNDGVAPAAGEVWIDELRLARGIRETDVASAVDVEVIGGEFLRSRVAYRNRGGFFRQLRGGPSFQDDRSLDVRTTLDMGRFAPESWRMLAPVTVSYESEVQSPIFLGQSDVRADRLPGLRRPTYGRTRVDLALRRDGTGEGGFVSDVLDGVDFRAGVVRTRVQTITTEGRENGVDAYLGYSTMPEPRQVRLFPGAAGRALRWLLPEFLEERIAGARLRWTPESVRVEGELLDRELSTSRYDQIIRVPGDSEVVPTLAPRRIFTTIARVALRPFQSLRGEVDVTSGRDLLRPVESTSDPATQDLLAAERRRLLGLDLGWEMDRRIQTRVSYQPQLTAWARTTVQLTTVYLSQRNPDLVELQPDSSLLLQRSADGQRNLTAVFALDPGRVFTDADERQGIVGWWARSFEPLTLTYSDGLTSRFNRETVDPGGLYQLGWGGRSDFLTIGGDTASTLSERDRINVRGGLRVVGPLTVGMAYDRSLNETLDTRSDRAVSRRVWPDVQATIAQPPLPAFLAPLVERFTLSSGYRREVRDLDFGVGGFQDRFREDREIPFTVSLGFPRGVGLTYRGRFLRGSGSDPTGDTRQTGDVHALTVSALFASPLAAFRRNGAPLRATLDVRYQDDIQCRRVSDDADCVAFIDQLERSASLSLDSTVRDFQLGVQLRFLDRRSFIGQRAGSTQFQLNLFGQFLLNAGMFPSPF